jgi:hypothetical protein
MSPSTVLLVDHDPKFGGSRLETCATLMPSNKMLLPELHGNNNAAHEMSTTTNPTHSRLRGTPLGANLMTPTRKRVVKWTVLKEARSLKCSDDQGLLFEGRQLET